MHLQLIGRLDPNETYAMFNIENVTNILTGNWINLELLNIIICQDQDHSHFESSETAPYPTDPNRYQDKIFVTIPKPRQVKFRRRTFQITDQVPMPLSQDAPAVAVPLKRQRLRRSIQLSPLQMEYSAIFKANIHRFDIADFPNNSVARLIDKLQNDQRLRIVNHFQKLLKSWPSYELISDLSSRRGPKKVKIVLPSLTRLMCTSREMFKLLGFENQIVALNVQGTAYFALMNSSRFDEKIFIGESAVETAMKFSVLYESETCPQLLRWHFMRYPDTFPATIVTFDESALCRQNFRLAEMFLRLTLECVEEFMALPSNCLTTTLTDNYLEIKKTPEFYNQSDNTNNFSILLRLGDRLQELLGFENSTIAWTLGKKDQKYKLIMPDPPESPEESTKCMTIASDVLPEHFNNQSGSYPFVTPRQERWQKYLLAQEELRRQQIQQELEEEERRRQQQQEAEPQPEREAEERQQEAEPQPEGEEERQQEAEPQPAGEEEERLHQEAERLQQEKERLRQEQLEREERQRQEEHAQEQTLEQQLLKKKKQLQQVTSDEEVAQEYVHSLETRESERIEQEKNNELQLRNQELTEIDTLEQQASSAARDGNVEEAKRLQQQWKDLKVEIDERQEQRRNDERDRINAFQVRLQASKDILSRLTKIRQDVEMEIRLLKEPRPAEEEEEEPARTAEEEEESERGRQQLLQDLEEEEERLQIEGGGYDADDDDDAEMFIQVEIDNPFPRPPTSFMVANSVKKHICTQPEQFPEHCTILLKEGEPDDYVTSRGLCCVLGIIRKSSPNIQSNTKCIIKRFQTLKYISLEFVDESLNTFKIAPEARPMWIKIDLSCNKYF